MLERGMSSARAHIFFVFFCFAFSISFICLLFFFISSYPFWFLFRFSLVSLFNVHLNNFVDVHFTKWIEMNEDSNTKFFDLFVYTIVIAFTIPNCIDSVKTLCARIWHTQIDLIIFFLNFVFRFLFLTILYIESIFMCFTLDNSHCIYSFIAIFNCTNKSKR